LHSITYASKKTSVYLYAYTYVRASIYRMSTKESEAKKKYWAGISKEERSRRGSHSATLGWAGKTKEEKQARAMKMVEAKRRKAK